MAPPPMLSAGISLNQLIEAMTDPAKRFEFPMKPPTAQFDLSPGTKITIIAATALLAGAIIYLATPKTR